MPRRDGSLDGTDDRPSHLERGRAEAIAALGANRFEGQAGPRAIGFNPRWIVGKTVARVEMHPAPDGRGGTYHSPVIHFADGSRIAFSTEETETGEYGTDITYRKPE